VIQAGLRHAAFIAARRTPVLLLATTAAAVIAVDEISKVLALSLLPTLETESGRFLQLGVLLNDDLAWGLSAGGESVTITAAVALLIVGLSFLICGALAKHDPGAPVMLGLIVGAGIANATDALTAPGGVVDWIAVGGIVTNLADAAVAVGLGFCGRTVWRLVGAMRVANCEGGGQGAAGGAGVDRNCLGIE
jgi:lipoprotein signal peptidase